MKARQLFDVLDSYVGDNNPQDLDVLPPELQRGTGERIAEFSSFDFANEFKSPEPFRALRIKANIATLLSDLRKIRQRLFSSLGEDGVKSLDAEFETPLRVLWFIKRGRDENSLSKAETSLLKSLLKPGLVGDSETLDQLSNVYYNYRTLAFMEPLAKKLMTSGDERRKSATSDFKADKEISIFEYVNINLLLDRKYFVDHWGIDGLNKIDEFLKVPFILRAELAKYPEVEIAQLDLLSSQPALDLTIHEFLKVAAEARPQIWIKEIPNEQALKSLVMEYLNALSTTARLSQDTYVLYSQPNWPTRLENDFNNNHLPAMAETKMNVVLRDKWLLEKFANSKAVLELDSKIKFVYDEDPTVRPPYEHLFQKYLGPMDIHDRVIDSREPSWKGW